MTGVVLSRAQRIGLLAAFEAAIFWAGIALAGWSALGGLVGGLVGAAIGISMATIGIERDVLSHEKAARAAVREYRDPGPDLRQEADAQARAMLATPTIERWAPSVVLSGLAAACVAVALVRDDPTVALPAGLLLVLAGIAVALRRRTDAVANRWLAEPPAPSDLSA